MTTKRKFVQINLKLTQRQMQCVKEEAEAIQVPMAAVLRRIVEEHYADKIAASVEGQEAQ